MVSVRTTRSSLQTVVANVNYGAFGTCARVHRRLRAGHGGSGRRVVARTPPGRVGQRSCCSTRRFRDGSRDTACRGSTRQRRSCTRTARGSRSTHTCSSASPRQRCHCCGSRCSRQRSRCLLRPPTSSLRSSERVGSRLACNRGNRSGSAREAQAGIFLSDKTVKNYVSSTLAKLNLKGRPLATAFVARHRLPGAEHGARDRSSSHVSRPATCRASPRGE